MHIYMNRAPVSGPYGGGNRLITALTCALRSRGHELTFDLTSAADIYICFDPRPNDRRVHGSDILRHRNAVKRGRIICRVGDIGTHGKPELRSRWTEMLDGLDGRTDVVVFPSRWALDSLRHTPTSDICTVIPNGAHEEFFRHRASGRLNDPISIVTSHWSSNAMKGFDLYVGLERALKRHARRYTFTYIGRTPSDVSFERQLGPLDVDVLAKELSRHDVYLTASKLEAGANHVLEAMAVGLPVVYSHDGGSVCEYVSDVGCGVQFDGTVQGALDALDHVTLRYEEVTSCSARGTYQRCVQRHVVDDYLRLIEA